MQRIDHSTAVSVKQSPLDTAAPGYFTRGDPLAGLEATWVTSDWANDVQENLCQLIEGASIALVKGDGTQLLKAVRVIAGQVGMPIGVPVPWMGATSTIPATCVVLMGQTLDRNLYPLAAAHALASGIIVPDADWLAQAIHRTKFSTGDGISTFRVPDLRGEAIYGADLGRGVRSAGIADWLAGELLAHVHAASTDLQGSHSHTGTTDTQGYHAHGGGTAYAGDHNHTTGMQSQSLNAHFGGEPLDPSDRSGNAMVTSTNGGHVHAINGDGSHAHNLSVNAAGSHSHNVTVNSAGGLETRQRGTGYPFIMRVK